MQLSNVQPRAIPNMPTASPAGSTPVADPRAGGGVQGIIGDLIRSSTAGYQQATKLAAVQVDKGAIHPFETISTATGLLKEKTANIKGVNKATGLLHTIGGFALLIMTANASSTMRSPGDTAVDLGNRLADIIDGKDTAQGWALGWGLRSPGSDEEAPEESGIGSALGSLGMK
ncbi:MAG: hypothetical protein JWM86_2270 [Thermoleophilia bacterium]|nr:hypothetical protein [Thermoleophilia bacterium]